MTLSTPSLTVCTCTLTDGTTFQVTGILDSPTDPRSPFKIISKCRDQNVPYRTALIWGVGAEGRQKVYYNGRVREAERKNGEKRLRIEEDEKFRRSLVAE